MSDICLTTDEIIDITGKQRSSAQLRELERLRIAARKRSDGTVLVFRRDIEQAPSKRNKKTEEPDYGAIA